jgi:hypothetical protein
MRNGQRQAPTLADPSDSLNSYFSICIFKIIITVVTIIAGIAAVFSASFEYYLDAAEGLLCVCNMSEPKPGPISVSRRRTGKVSITILLLQFTDICTLFVGWVVTVDVIIVVFILGKDIEDGRRWRAEAFAGIWRCRHDRTRGPGRREGRRVVCSRGRQLMRLWTLDRQNTLSTCTFVEWDTLRAIDAYLRAGVDY